MAILRQEFDYRKYLGIERFIPKYQTKRGFGLPKPL